MKTKITFLITFCLILSSCIKGFYGHPDDKNGILTETNYFYSDDFKTEFLKIQISKLDDEIKELTAIEEAGQGNDTTKERLIAANEERETTADQVIAIAVNRDLVYRRRPPIPGPCPQIENCFPDIQYIAIPPGLDFYELIVYDANDEIIGTTEGNPVALGNVGGLLDYVVFIFDGEGYQGEIQIQIKERLSPNEDINEIILDSNIGQ